MYQSQKYAIYSIQDRKYTTYFKRPGSKVLPGLKSTPAQGVKIAIESSVFSVQSAQPSQGSTRLGIYNIKSILLSAYYFHGTGILVIHFGLYFVHTGYM